MGGYELPDTAEEFLRVWHILAAADNTPQLEAWEGHFDELAKTDPDMTLDILRSLAADDSYNAQEAAAIYARCTYQARRSETTELLASLARSGSAEIREKVADTVDMMTSDPQTMSPPEAADLITAVGVRQESGSAALR